MALSHLIPTTDEDDDEQLVLLLCRLHGNRQNE